MKAAARQRYYNRGSNADWKAERAANGDAAFICRFFGYTGLVIAGVLVALVASQLGAFHTFVMLVLTSPLWIIGAILLMCNS